MAAHLLKNISMKPLNIRKKGDIFGVCKKHCLNESVYEI